MQEAFLRVFGRFGDLRSDAAFPQYLRRTIVNVLRTRARREARDRDRVTTHNRLSGMPEVVVQPETDQGLWEAVNGLPDRQRIALVCRYWLDLSERDTAAVLGCRRGTVKSLLARGLTALREVILDE